MRAWLRGLPPCVPGAGGTGQKLRSPPPPPPPCGFSPLPQAPRCPKRRQMRPRQGEWCCLGPQRWAGRERVGHPWWEGVAALPPPSPWPAEWEAALASSPPRLPASAPPPDAPGPSRAPHRCTRSTPVDPPRAMSLHAGGTDWWAPGSKGRGVVSSAGYGGGAVVGDSRGPWWPPAGWLPARRAGCAEWPGTHARPGAAARPGACSAAPARAPTPSASRGSGGKRSPWRRPTGRERGWAAGLRWQGPARARDAPARGAPAQLW